MKFFKYLKYSIIGIMLFYLGTRFQTQQNIQTTAEMQTQSQQKNIYGSSTIDNGNQVNDNTNHVTENENNAINNIEPVESTIPVKNVPTPTDNSSIVVTPSSSKVIQSTPNQIEQKGVSIESNKLCINGISIIDNYSKILNNYNQYLKPSSTAMLKFFNGGSGQYGDFLMTVELRNAKVIGRITYLQYNFTNPILTMNLGNLKIGDGKNKIISEYGKYDREEINGDVDRLFYDNFSYQGQAVNLIIYTNKQTSNVYGYEISLK